MDVHFDAKGVLVSPEAMSAAASYVEREYGDGHHMGASHKIVARRVAVFEVVHFDGSRFNIVADDYGNVERIPDGISPSEAVDIVRAMSQRACAP